MAVSPYKSSSAGDNMRSVHELAFQQNWQLAWPEGDDIIPNKLHKLPPPEHARASAAPAASSKSRQLDSSTGRAQSSAGETSWDCHQPSKPLVLDKGRIRWKVFSDTLSNRQVEGATCATAGTAQIA
jgi:hypothetical protein